MKRLALALFLLTVLVGAVLLVAGGPSQGQALDAVGSHPGGSVALAQPSQSLTIGTLLPLTGDLSEYGLAMQKGAELAKKHLNDSGGVLGLPVVLVAADSQCDPEAAVDAAQSLIDDDGVDAIVGAVCSGVTIAVAQQVTIPSHVLLISPASTSPAITTLADDDLVFRTVNSDEVQGRALAQLAWDQDFRTACTMYVDNAYGQGLSSSFTEAFEALGGTVQVQVPHGDQSSYLTELSQCTSGNPDVLAALSYPQHGVVYLDEALDNTLIDQFIFADGLRSQDVFDSLNAQYPGAFEGMYGTSHLYPFTAEFSSAYEAEYGEPPALPYIAEAYDAVAAIALAAETAGSNGSLAIRDALRGTACPPGPAIGAGAAAIAQGLQLAAARRQFDYEGGTGVLEFNGYGDAARGTLEIWKIQSGQIVTDREEPVAPPDADGDGVSDACYFPVGGIAELPAASDSSVRNYITPAALAAAALLALSAGAWHARRRWPE
jgi:ABC-type branched-subunit amino acid transport system substrate-binding protein